MQKYFDINDIDPDKKYNIIFGGRHCPNVPSNGLAVKIQHAIQSLFTYYVDGKEVTEEEFIQHLRG